MIDKETIEMLHIIWNYMILNMQIEKSDLIIGCGCVNLEIPVKCVEFKYLIEEKGYTVSDAWKAVCDESKNLGHYINSEKAKHDLKNMGSRQVGEWYDLANTRKLIIDDETDGFWIVSGGCDFFSSLMTLAFVMRVYYYYVIYENSVGWLVLSV